MWPTCAAEQTSPIATGGGVANSDSNSGQSVRWEHREDPAPLVRDHHEHRVQVRTCAGPQQAAGVVEERQVPEQRVHGAIRARRRRRGPSRSSRRSRSRRGSRSRARRSPSCQTRGGRRGAMKASRSRTGVDDPTASSAPFGRNAATSRATRGSVGSSQPSSARSTAAWATRSDCRHASSQAGRRRQAHPLVRLGPTRARRTARDRPRSAARREPRDRGRGGRGRARRGVPASATSACVARVVGVAPAWSTTSGRWRWRQRRVPGRAAGRRRASARLAGVQAQTAQRLGEHGPPEQRGRTTGATASRAGGWRPS